MIIISVLPSALPTLEIPANRIVDMDNHRPRSAHSPDDVFGHRPAPSPGRNLMRRLPSVSLRLPVVILVFAAALIFIPFIQGPTKQRVSAHGGGDKFYVECLYSQVREGWSATAYYHRVTNHENHKNNAFYTRWNTRTGTAQLDDFEYLVNVYDNEPYPFSVANFIVRYVETTDDDEVEDNETFRIRVPEDDTILDMDDAAKDNECVVTIVDDDPHVTAVEILSSPVQGDTYGLNETIRLAAHFNREVIVDGNLRMGFTIGSTWKGAPYASGSGTKILVFEHTVVASDSDTDGIHLSRGYTDSEGNRHGLVSGKALDKVETDTRSFHLYAGTSARSGHKVDGSYEAPLTLLEASTNTAGSKVILTFNRDIEIPSLLQTLSDSLDIDLGRFYAAVFDVYAGGNGTRPVDSRNASKDGAKLTIDIQSAHYISSADQVNVAYNNIFAEDSEGMFLDSADNILENFEPFSVNNVSTHFGTTFQSNKVSGPTDLTIDEGSSATYSVGIDYYPGSSINRVRFSVYPAGALTLSSNSVSFNQFNWQDTKSITVTPNPSEDDDSVNTWARLTATSSAAFTETLRTRVLIEDDD